MKISDLKIGDEFTLEYSRSMNVFKLLEIEKLKTKDRYICELDYEQVIVSKNHDVLLFN